VAEDDLSEIKRVAHINPSDEAGFTESEDRRMIAEKNGFTNVGNEYFKRGSTDMYPVATRMVGFNADLIDFGGTIGRDQGLAVKALRELGYKGHIDIGYSDAKSFVDIAGRTRRRNAAVRYARRTADSGTKRTGGLVVEEIRPPFPSYAFLMWDWPFMLAQAMQERSQSIRSWWRRR